MGGGGNCCMGGANISLVDTELGKTVWERGGSGGR